MYLTSPQCATAKLFVSQQPFRKYVSTFGWLVHSAGTQSCCLTKQRNMRVSLDLFGKLTPVWLPPACMVSALADSIVQGTFPQEERFLLDKCSSEGCIKENSAGNDRQEKITVRTPAGLPKYQHMFYDTGKKKNKQ